MRTIIVSFALVLSSLATAQVPCGLEGSVDERIIDCSYQKEGFVLVTRSKDFKEVHMEVSTGLLWSDRLPFLATHHDAKNACRKDLAEVAGLSDLHWILPSIEHYKEAEKSGIRKALQNMNFWFWSSSASQRYSADAWMFNGNDGAIRHYYRSSDFATVRCVVLPPI